MVKILRCRNPAALPLHNSSVRVTAVASHGGRNPLAARRNLSARLMRAASVRIRQNKRQRHAVYFTATCLRHDRLCQRPLKDAQKLFHRTIRRSAKSSARDRICKIVSASGVPRGRARFCLRQQAAQI